MTANVL